MKDKKEIKVMFKEAGTLFAITLIAGLMLGFVYELTKEPISVQRELKRIKACQAVFSEEATDFEQTELAPSITLQEEIAEEGITIGETYIAKDINGEALGYVIAVTSSKGYAGDIKIYMGINKDGVLNGISILETSETPGLGMKAKKILVPQFANKKVNSISYSKTGAVGEGQIDAISGATITTKAITNAVNGGLKYYQTELVKGGEDHE